jgi:hypothetical protein
VITRISKIKPLSVVVADKGYDSEDNHVMVREKLRDSVLHHPGMKKMYQYGKLVANTERK